MQILASSHVVDFSAKVRRNIYSAKCLADFSSVFCFLGIVFGGERHMSHGNLLDFLFLSSYFYIFKYIF